MQLNFKKEKAGLIYHFTTSNTALFRILPQFRLRLNERESDDGLGGYACRILSFSEDYFSDGEWWDGYGLSRMWEQCGENHEGVCLVIDKKEFVAENIELLGSDSVFFEAVTYTNRPDTPLPVQRDAWKFRRNNDQRRCFQKNKEWENEHEVRLLSLDPVTEFCSIRRSLKSILTGVRFERDKLRLLIERAGGKQVSA